MRFRHFHQRIGAAAARCGLKYHIEEDGGIYLNTCPPRRAFVAGPAINPMIKLVNIGVILVVELFFV